MTVGGNHLTKINRNAVKSRHKGIEVLTLGGNLAVSRTAVRHNDNRVVGGGVSVNAYHIKGVLYI